MQARKATEKKQKEELKNRGVELGNAAKVVTVPIPMVSGWWTNHKVQVLLRYFFCLHLFVIVSSY